MSWDGCALPRNSVRNALEAVAEQMFPCAPARATKTRSPAGKNSAATSDHDRSRAAAADVQRIATAALNCWRYCSVCFPFAGNRSPTAPIKGRSFTGHGRHPAPPRDQDRQAIQSGQGLHRPAQALDGQTHHPWLNRWPRLAKDWENRARLPQARLNPLHHPKTL